MKVWVGGNTYMVNGVRQPYVRIARHESQRTSKLLSKAVGFDVAVQGLVVPVAVGDFTIKKQPEDVKVVNRGRLAKYLRQQPTVLDDRTITAIYDQAKLSTTWV